MTNEQYVMHFLVRALVVTTKVSSILIVIVAEYYAMGTEPKIGRVSSCEARNWRPYYPRG
jgi:hypothetical protein